MMVTNRRTFVKACLAGISTTTMGPFAHAIANDDVINRQLRFTLSFSNPHAHELQNQILWAYMPATTAMQQMRRLNVSMDYETLSDSLGHNIVKLAFPRFAPLASKLVTIAADVTLRTHAAAPLPDSHFWMGSERFIETSDPHIQHLAIQLKRATPFDTAKSIHDWVRQNLQYTGYIADDLGARYALMHGRGDCTEYAYLAVALARANGIAARMVGGYVTDRNIAPRAEDYHNWAEVHVDGAWRLLDAQKGNWLAPADQYVAFRFYRDEEINPIGLAHRFKINGPLQVRF